MSDYTKLKDNKQIAAPAKVYPELMHKVIRLKVQADSLADELTSEKIAQTFSISREAIDKHVKKERKNHGK